MQELMIHEILIKVGEASKRAEKVAVLVKHNCLALRDCLRGAFDDTIVWILPKGRPTFEAGLSKEGFSPTTLRRQSKMFAYFVKGGPGETLPAAKRERMFLQVLEGIHPKDADLIVLVKDKKLGGVYPGLTESVVREAFPNLIKAPVKATKPDQT